MSRFDFMRKLEGLLLDIPLEERDEALKYYNDYFDDAGVDNEEKIISELGSPERIAGIIKADLKDEGGSNQDRGFYTEKGYKDTIYEEEKFEVVKQGKVEQHDSNSWQNNTNNDNNTKTNTNNTTNTNIILIILICIFALPVGIPLFFSVVGIVISIIAVIISLLFSFGIAGIVMVPAGIAMIFVGLVKMGIPFIGLSLCGGGLVLLGLGILFVMLSVWLCKTVLPAIVRGLVSLFRLPFKNRSVSA
jgi:uncharacterized membrane protein